MNERQKLGRRGEDKACAYLISGGYRIVARNYKTKVGETDIIAEKDGRICFIEVKTRTSLDYGLPGESVDRRRQARLRRCAQWFINERGLSGADVRFDVIEIIVRGGTPWLRHTEGAF